MRDQHDASRARTHSGIYLQSVPQPQRAVPRMQARTARLGCLDELSSVLAGVFQLHVEDAILQKKDRLIGSGLLLRCCRVA